MDEGFGGGFGGVEEDDVFGVAAGGIDGEEDDWGGVDFGHGVDGGSLEVEEVAGGEGGGVGGRIHPEGAGAGEDVEILVGDSSLRQNDERKAEADSLRE